MAHNKVTYKDEVLMDITDSTVTPETLSEGVVAYGANGERIVGTATGGGSVSAPLIIHSASLEYGEEYGHLHSATWESISIGEGVTSIGKYAFDSCRRLTNVTIPSSVTIIGEHAFSNCTSLTSITIPDSVTSIGKWAFGQSSLTSIIIPDSVTSIGAAAFYACESLTSINIPHSVTNIGEYAFMWCYSLTELNYNGTVAEWTTLNTDYISTQSITVHCTDGDTTAKWHNPDSD